MEVSTVPKSPSKDRLLNEDSTPVSPSSTITTTSVTDPGSPISPAESEKSPKLALDSISNMHVYQGDGTLESRKVVTNLSIADPLPPAPVIIDLSFLLPDKVEESLTPPKFSPNNTLNDLPKLLKTSYLSLNLAQREKYRTFLHDFIGYYANINAFENNAQLRYNPELIDLTFNLITDHKHIAIDKLFGLLTILTRQAKIKGPKEEPRVEHILNFIKENPLSPAVKDAIRSLINLAETNAELIGQRGGVDLLINQVSSHMQDNSFLLQCIWVLRNLSVTESLRKQIMDRVGFLIVNAMNSYVQDAFLAETCCWTLGNLVLTNENVPLLSAVGAFPASKNALMVHSTKESLVESVCWFFYNATFDTSIIKPLLRFGLEDPLTAVSKKYSQNKNILTWTSLIIRRIRACLQLNSPQAAAERLANLAVREGPMTITLSEKSKPFQQHVILQPQRIAWSSKSEGLEITGEIRLKEVFHINRERDNIVMKVRYNFDQEKTVSITPLNANDIDLWLRDIKTTWTNAVAAITEVHNANGYMSGLFNVPETITSKDLEKTIDAYVLHEIYSNPHYVTFVFKSQRSFPNLTLWDLFATIITKKYSKEIQEKAKDFKVNDTEVYDYEKIKKEASSIIETRLINDAAEFDKNPTFTAPPVLTRYEYCAKQGIRPTMEDKHIHQPFIDLMVGRDGSTEPVSYYAVYDGHGGVTVADYVERHLHVNIMKHPLFETDPKKAIAEAFFTTNNELKENSERLFQSNTAGSTGVVIIFKGKKLYVAWVGDSMASMFTPTKDINLVDPHKPGSDSEKARIEKLGGFVSEEGGIMRVNGIVAVSRAFGNFRHKVIVPEPDFKEFDLKGDEQYIVLACDGLWDVMNNDSLRKFVKKYLATHGRKTQGISEALVDHSLKLGSTDNVSCIFIEFNWWKEPKRCY